MEELEKLLKESLNEKLYQIILSNPRKKENILKIKIRPVMVKGVLMFQETRFIGTKVYHKNLTDKELTENILTAVREDFRQMEVSTADYKGIVLVGKKGGIRVTRKRAAAEQTGPDLSHNRAKRYILEEGRPVGFLVDLGVQTTDGRIVRSKYDKFKQINRYLEFIEDILPILPKGRTLNIIDFGCGKSYLTFAMYYYLKVLNGLDIRVTGLDLKEDVIRECEKLAKEYGYDGLHFQRGDIGSYEGSGEADMVVTLHACDTATDFALQKAVLWNAKVILSVPCCQHELNGQLSCAALEPVFGYGLIKERMAALITDAVRARLLEQMGYETQLLEFIDMEHTPKNILIRAVKKKGAVRKEEEGERLQDMCRFLGIRPTLGQLLLEESRGNHL